MSEKVDLTEETKQQNGANLSRRKFLQILGSASAVGAVGCAEDKSTKILPFVKGEEDQIPGVSVWYRSTCMECSAGCGIDVRTREGRAVKIEGSKENPINRGGLCALGQSSLQGLYDPDRLRGPMARTPAGTYKEITWDKAYESAKAGLKDNAAKKLIITGEVSGALEELITEWCASFNAEHHVYELSEQSNLARANELVHGVYGIPTYSFDRASVVLNFGADFLETWVSPCGFARDWAKGKRAQLPLRTIHVEPRLSLTGANADTWLNANPGSEVRLALAILKILVERGRGTNLSDDVLSSIKRLVSKIELVEVAEETGISTDQILVVAEHLFNASSAGSELGSIVLAGGASAATKKPAGLHVAVGFLNLVLGNIGRTVSIAQMRRPRSDAAAIKKLVGRLNKGEFSMVLIYGTNPAFTLPQSNGFRQALRQVAPNGTQAPLIFSFAQSLDETAKLADYILPTNTSLESWGDQRALAGVYSLVQPAMTPLFDTRTFGNVLLDFAKGAGHKEVGGGAKDYLAYLQNSWRKLHSSLGIGGEFNRFWMECVERGGYFPTKELAAAKVKVDPSCYSMAFLAAEFDTPDVARDGLVLMPYLSVKSFDGRAANRPWMQELPDPIAQAVWDSWAEIHPDTAAHMGISAGDFVKLRNRYGEINVAVYLTPHIHRNVVAVPIGQGRNQELGRYAREVQGGSVLELLPPIADDEAAPGLGLLTTRVSVSRGRGRAQLTILSGSDSQHGRELAQTMMVVPAVVNGTAVVREEQHGAGHGGGHHSGEIKQMYQQREHPLYRWGMGVDLASCTGCSACVVACYAENNIAVVGKKRAWEGREMSWLRIERYIDGGEADGHGEEFRVSFLPMMCQQCGNAPCEPVCPVYATYHNEDGLNAMIYNRCVGTRYCSNNCSYKVRRYNWYDYELPSPMEMQLNPDVTKRTVGIMEKCTFCVQRIAEGKDLAKDQGRMVKDGEITPACVQSCPTEALVFGNLNDPNSRVSQLSHNERSYKVLDEHLNTQPAITYLKDIKYKA